MQYLTIREVTPADAAAGFLRDGVILIALEPTVGPSQASTAEVVVLRTDGDEVVEGALRGWGVGDQYQMIWQPLIPFAADTEYRVQVSISPALTEVDGLLESSTTFTTSSALAPALTLEGEPSVTLRDGTAPDCTNRNNCGGCIPADHELPALYADVDLPVVAGGFADNGYELTLLVDEDSPFVRTPSASRGPLSGFTVFGSSLPERVTLELPALDHAYAPCFSLYVSDSALHRQELSWCLDEIDVAARLAANDDSADVGDDAALQQPADDAPEADADAGSDLPPDQADAQRKEIDLSDGEGTGCTALPRPARATPWAIVLALLTVFGIRRSARRAKPR